MFLPIPQLPGNPIWGRDTTITYIARVREMENINDSDFLKSDLFSIHLQEKRIIRKQKLIRLASKDLRSVYAATPRPVSGISIESEAANRLRAQLTHPTSLLIEITIYKPTFGQPVTAYSLSGANAEEIENLIETGVLPDPGDPNRSKAKRILQKS